MRVSVGVARYDIVGTLNLNDVAVGSPKKVLGVSGQLADQSRATGAADLLVADGLLRRGGS